MILYLNFENAELIFNKEKVKDKNLSSIASFVSDEVFSLTPIVHNELIVRDRMSAMSVSGSVSLLKLIFNNEIIDTWSDKKWPYDMLSEVEWLVKEQDKIGNILKKGNLILTGAYGLPIPINDKKLIEVTSSLFGNVSALFQ